MDRLTKSQKTWRKLVADIKRAIFNSRWVFIVKSYRRTPGMPEPCIFSGWRRTKWETTQKR